MEVDEGDGVGKKGMKIGNNEDTFKKLAENVAE